MIRTKAIVDEGRWGGDVNKKKGNDFREENWRRPMVMAGRNLWQAELTRKDSLLIEFGNVLLDQLAVTAKTYATVAFEMFHAPMLGEYL